MKETPNFLPLRREAAKNNIFSDSIKPKKTIIREIYRDEIMKVSTILMIFFASSRLRGGLFFGVKMFEGVR
jgi:hypothetical protein